MSAIDRATILSYTLAELAQRELWLVVSCSCPRARALLHGRLLARSHGPRMLVRDLLPRLTCKVCGARPVSVIATDRADGLGQGGPTPTVVVELV